VATAFKLTLKELDFVQVLFFSSWASLFTLLIIIVLQGKIQLIFHQSKKDLINSLFLGLINPTLYYFVLFKAYSLLPAQEAQSLNWTWPIVLTLLSALFLRQKIEIKSIFAILISFSGVMVISTKGDFAELTFRNLTGDLLAVSSSLLWATYWIFNLKDQREPVVKLSTNFLFGVIYNSIVLYFFRSDSINIKGLIGSCYIGLFEMGITFVVWLKALSLARKSSSVAIFAYLTPFLSLILINFILKESIRLSSFLGLILIISGVVLNTAKFGKAGY
jgi:drug/metabolite transporter (DMT)-like permease